MANVKRTKREEWRIIVWNIFFWTLIVIMVVIWFIFIQPEMKTISEKKTNVLALYNKLDESTKKWIDLQTFQNTLKEKSSELGNEYDKNYMNSLVWELKKDFYEKNLKNNTNDNYKTFIEKKKEEYKNNTLIEEKIKVTSKVLPYYSDSLKEEDTLTDFQFINYLESLISSFNLASWNSIWIKEIRQVWNYTLSKTDNSLDKWIYEIPVELSLVWRKSSMIDLLYFIENVWKVRLDEETKDIIINKEESKQWDLFYEFKTKKLDWQKNSPSDYNIFNNQIADIESIDMKEYIDSSEQNLNSTENGNVFIKNLKNNQAKERFEMSLKINFYVKWLPKYKIDEYFQNFNKRLTDLKTKINEVISNQNISSSKKQTASNIKISVENIETAVKQKSSTPNSQNWLDEIYNDLTWYEAVLIEYEKEIKQINW